MKRSTFKRITALVLVLVMTLSMLPTTVWAATTLVAKNWLSKAGVTFYTDKSDTELSCDSSITAIDSSETPHFKVTCEGDQKTIYISVAKSDTLSASFAGVKADSSVFKLLEDVQVDRSGNLKFILYELTVKKGEVSTYDYTLVRSYEDGSDTPITVTFEFSAQPDSSEDEIQEPGAATEAAQLYWLGDRNVWTNEEYIADKGTTHWFDVGVNADGTALVWETTPTITPSSDTLGTFELFKEDEKSRIKWDTTNASEGRGSVTLNVDGVNYVLNVCVNVLPDGGGNGGEQNNYQSLHMYGKGQDGNYNYFNGTGFPVGGVQEFPLYIWAPVADNQPWEYVPITEADGYILGCSDEILNGRITWSTAEGKENVAIVDTRGITVDAEKQVYLTATKDDITYGLRLFLNPGGNQDNGPLELGGVKIFTSFEMGKFGYNDGDAKPTKQSIPNGQTMAFIPMMPKSGYTPNVVKSVYLVSSEELTPVTDNGAVFGGATLTLTDITLDNNQKVYLLKMPGQSEGTEGDVKVKIGSSNNVLLLRFRAQWNGQNMSCWKDYVTSSGNSTVTVRLSPEQAPLITLPESINENNELIITVHNAAVNDDAVWEALVNRNQGFLVPFEYGSIEENGVSKPQVKSIGTGYTIEKSLEMLEDENFSFSNYYQGGGGVRMNGLFFAWTMEDAGRTIIVPTEDSMTGAWIWRYEDTTNDNGYTDKKDGVIVKFVLDENISNAVTLEQNDEEYVAESQIQELSYPTLKPCIDFVRGTDNALSYTNGTLKYQYKGEKADYKTITAELRTLAENHNATNDQKITINNEGNGDILCYPLLEISAPADGYRIKSVATAYDDSNYDGGASVVLWYNWWGPGSEVTYTLTWVDADNSDSTNLPARVQQITIKTPGLSSGETWMDHINDGENHATPVPAGRLVLTDLAKGCGAQHVYTPGYLLTKFDNSNTDLDVEEILSSEISVKAPSGAKGYRLVFSSDGNDDPSYNCNNAWSASSFQENVEAAALVVLAEGQTTTKVSPLEDPLRKQVLGDIEYYYSADRGTRLLLLKWIFDLEDEDNKANDPNQNPVYEYIQMDTTPYYCTLKSKLSDIADNVVVDKPMADVTAIPEGNIYLETRIHPQDKGYGQYFFELRLVDGVGNTIVEDREDGYTIILPYSFMGEEWSFDMAKNLKEKPIINHYDKNFNLKKNNGAITGTYTERGIEFVVNDFSPFMLTWTKETKEPTTPVMTATDNFAITYGDKNQQVSVTVTKEENHTYTYQWYDANGEAISGAESAVYVLPEDLLVGEYSYYCIVKAKRDDNDKEVFATSDRITVTVEKATPVAIAPTGLAAIYGDMLADVKLPDNWSWKDSEMSVGDVGNNTFTVVYTPADTANYNTVEKQVTVVVSKQKVEKPVADTTAFTYNGNAQTYAMADSTLYEISNETQTNAGSYNVIVALMDPANFEWADGTTDTLTFAFVITPKAVSVTAESKTKTYGDVDPMLTYTAEGMVNGESLSNITLTRVAGENVGEYAITAKQGENANKNYAIAFVDGALTVEQKEIGIEWGNTAFTYTGSAQVPTATATGLVNDDEVILTVSSEQTDAGSYTATVTAVSNDNYKLPEVVTTQFTIAKAVPAYDIPTNLIATYGQKLENVTLPDGWTWVDKAQSVDAVGSKMFAAMYRPDDEANYSTVESQLQVTVKKATVAKPAMDNTKYIYTGGEQTYRVEASDLYTVRGATRTKVGSQTVVIELNNPMNYAWDDGNSDPLEYIFAIGKAPVTVRANNHAVTYGDKPGNNGVTYIGLVGTDTALSGTVEYSYTYTQYGNVGSYKITPSGLTSNNYDITFVDGTLTVEQKEIGIQWSNTALTYTGNAQKPVAAATGLVNGDAVTLTVSGEQTDAGSYTAAVTAVSNSNYKLPADVTKEFTIGKATQTAPVVVGISETIFAKCDGKINGVDSTMEYSTDGENYTAINGEKIENLAAGTYYVRVKGDDNHNPSPATTVEIAAGRKLVVTFVADGAIVGTVYVAHGSSIIRPTDPTKDKAIFAGWYSDDACTKAWNFSKDVVTGDLTLYAKWSDAPVFHISGTVNQLTGNGNETVAVIGATVDLKLGTKLVATETTAEGGAFYFDGQVEGDYNLVITSGEKVVTALVALHDYDEDGLTVTLPKDVTNSVVEHETAEEGKDSVVAGALVGGLEDVAVAVRGEYQGADKVEVKLSVSDQQPVTGTPEEGSEAAKQQTEQKAIQQKAPGKQLVFFELNVMKRINNGTPEAITDTGATLLEIRIPFEKSNKWGITIYRYHDDQAEALAAVSEGSDDEGFWVGDDGYIHIYTKKFSTYAIGYTETGSTPGGYYPVVTPTTPVEKPADAKPAESKPVDTPVAPPSGETVTPAPEDTTPVVPDAPVVDDPVEDVPAVEVEPSSNAGLWVGVGVVALAAIVVVLAIMAARKKRKQ